MALPNRKCGECSLCCKVLDIRLLDKPSGEWCGECRPGHGCAIYQARPLVCQSYECLWLTDKELGDEWKPSRSHMVLQLLRLNVGLILEVNVDCEHPDAWKQPPYYAKLKELRAFVPVQVNVGKRHWAILANVDVEFSKDGKPECVLIEGDGYRIVPVEQVAVRPA
jgi:hypothetical protein